MTAFPWRAPELEIRFLCLFARTRERFLPSPLEVMHGNFLDDPPPEEPALPRCPDEEV
jgi:hypothetical protein